MVEHSAKLYGLLGLFPLDACEPVIYLATGPDGAPRSYAKVKSTPRWVFYKGSLDDVGGEGTKMHPQQR